MEQVKSKDSLHESAEMYGRFKKSDKSCRTERTKDKNGVMLERETNCFLS